MYTGSTQQYKWPICLQLFVAPSHNLAVTVLRMVLSMSMYMYVYMYICIYVCMYVCMYVFMYVKCVSSQIATGIISILASKHFQSSTQPQYNRE